MKIVADENLCRLFLYRLKIVISFVLLLFLASDYNFCRFLLLATFLYLLTFLPTIIINADFFLPKGTLTAEERTRLVSMQKVFGNKWQKIGFMMGRYHRCMSTNHQYAAGA